MRLFINTASTFKGGGVQVAKSFIEECKNIPGHDYLIVLSESLSKAINSSDFPENFRFHKAKFRPATRVFSFKSHNGFLKLLEKEFQPDVVFTTTGPSYWRPKAPHLMGYNIPHYVYPESPYFKLLPLKKRIYWKCMKVVGYANFKYNADSYVVQTNDVQQRLKKFINKPNIYTVYNTINAHYLNPKEYPNKLSKKVKDEFRLLTISAWYPHKNIGCIPYVIEELKRMGVDKIKFVLTIDKDKYKEANLDRYPEIVNLGPVKIEEAASLYRECDAMFLPSLLECFSASYVEAMKMKKPILTSDLGFAHTICKNSAVYFNPLDPEDIANKIIALYTNDEMKNNLINNGVNLLSVFGSPKDRARKYLEICSFLLNLDINENKR